GSPPLPEASCDPVAGGVDTVRALELVATLSDRWHEAWLGSPAVADLDGDGTNEIIVPRDELLQIWHLDGTLRSLGPLQGRIWSSPVVADLLPEREGLEVAVAARGQIAAWDASGSALPGFPVTWRDELRSLAAGDIDGDGELELVAVTTSDLDANGQTDIMIAVHADGSVVAGFPPNTTGAAGCDDACYVHAGYDQNVGLGDVDGDGVLDVLAPQDNAYVSLHTGDGRAFDAAPIFRNRTKFSGVRFMLDYAEAQQGYAEDEATANQAHFTNTAPAIVDVDGDGTNEIVMLGSVQNAAQDERERGVVLFVVRNDGTRPDDWVAPFHAPDFLDGLWDAGDNIVGATNQVSVADIDPESPRAEFVFAGFDGRIHAVSSDNRELWSREFTTRAGVLTGGVVVADLSGDGRPEIVFNTYGTDEGEGELIVLASNGDVLHRVPLPERGAMPVPTIADVDGDGTLEIVVSLKDGVDRERQVLVYGVPGSADNCLLWPTGRGNLLRTGFVALAAAPR
ncbi:MAG TPA: VCBS repeat-containing protein, partial [Polyangiaceae bacterium]